MRKWTYNNLGATAVAIQAYLDDLECRVQRERIHLNGAGGIILPRTQHGLDAQAIIRSIRDRESMLESLEGDFAEALKSSDFEQSQTIKKEIEIELPNFLRIS